MLLFLKESSCLDVPSQRTEEHLFAPRHWHVFPSFVPAARPFLEVSPTCLSLSILLPPRSHFIIICPRHIVPLWLYLNGVPFFFFSSTKGSYGNTTVRPCVEMQVFIILEKKCRKSMQITGHYKWRGNIGISMWLSSDFISIFHSYFSDYSKF